MWEQVRANKHKSVALVLCIALLLIVLGFVIGMALFGGYRGGRIYLNDPQSFAGGILGIIVAITIWLVMTVTAYFGGARILLASSKAHAIEKSDHPQLYNVVEEMTIASGIGKMPKIYIIDDMSPNAFATGRDPENSAIAVTAGLLAKLNRDQLQGVVAHEMSHIVNRDVLFMTMIGVMVGSITIMAELFLRSLWFTGGRRRSRYDSKGGGQAQLILMLVALVLAILAPIAAQIIYFAASRRREYLADANAAILTRYPEGLASALETIAKDTTPLTAANKVTAPMYIASPAKKRSFTGLASTHPPIENRIRILRAMGGNASFAAYQQGWKRVEGKNAAGLPASALAGAPRVPARKPQQAGSGKPANSRRQLRQATDALRNANKYLFLACTCGLRIKLPPEFKQDHVKCPRCGRDVRVPTAQMATMAT
ncbi:MAG: M48 family metallopeptidase, partial [Candidatus Hydrogenedentes bacterium]|nr:M48 family metallopeptidase [Candidatus Hydrogenedentota bacterium]